MAYFVVVPQASVSWMGWFSLTHIQHALVQRVNIHSIFSTCFFGEDSLVNFGSKLSLSMAHTGHLFSRCPLDLFSSFNTCPFKLKTLCSNLLGHDFLDFLNSDMFSEASHSDIIDLSFENAWSEAFTFLLLIRTCSLRHMHMVRSNFNRTSLLHPLDTHDSKHFHYDSLFKRAL